MKASWISACMSFLVLFAMASPATEAAEIKIVDGPRPGQKVVIVSGPINPEDDDRFYSSRLFDFGF